jgi:hypothetical protein
MAEDQRARLSRHDTEKLRFEMRLRNFIIAYTLVPAMLVFAVRRPAPPPQNRYSQVVDLTATTLSRTGSEARSGTRIISPAALLPGTWGAAQIPADRLIGPLVVMELNASSAEISIDDSRIACRPEHGTPPWRRGPAPFLCHVTAQVSTRANSVDILPST